MSTQFQNHCLASPIEDIKNIEVLFASVNVMERSDLILRVRRLCRSHERLRAMLEGSEAMIDRMDRKQRHGCTDAACKECDR